MNCPLCDKELISLTAYYKCPTLWRTSKVYTKGTSHYSRQADNDWEELYMDDYRLITIRREKTSSIYKLDPITSLWVTVSHTPPVEVKSEAQFRNKLKTLLVFS